MTERTFTYTGYADHCQVGHSYHEIVDSDGFEVVNQNGIVTDAKDARVLAASQDLLAALDAALDEVDQMRAEGFPEPAWAKQARIAVAKARPETK